MNNKRLLSLGCVAVLLAAGAMPAPAEIVGDFPEVVLFSEGATDIGQNSTVHSGDVVANNAVVPPFALTIGNKATFPFGYEVEADSINVGNFVNLNGITLCNVPPTGVCDGPLTPLPVYGELPIFQNGTAGTTPVNVPKSGSASLTPGTYGNVTVGLEGTITFQGPGIFNLGSFTTGRKAQIVVSGASEIRIAGDMNTGVEDNINLSGPPARDVIFYVNGNASLGSKTTINANFYVNGLLELQANVTGTGAFLATNNAVLGQKVQLTLDTFFDFQPVPAPDAKTTDEDNAVTIDVLANDSDPEGDPLFVNSFTQGANGGSVGCSSGNPPPCAVDEDLEYTPAQDYFGGDSFTYVVCDVDSLPNSANADNCADPTTVSVTVTSVNDPPSFVKGPDQSVDEDAGPQSVSGWATSISPGPANESGQTVSFLVSNDNNALFAAQPAIDGSGTLTYTPADDAFGSATVTVQAKDNGGVANNGDDTSDPQTFTISVTSVNDPPVAADDPATTDEDTPVTIDVLANDSAGPANEDQTLTIEPLGGTGSEAQVVNNKIEYTPPADFFGPRVFTYTACDSGDGADDPTTLCDSAEVTVEVTPVNDAPTADPQSLFATDTVTITLTGSDPDGDSLTFSVVSGPSKGALGTITPVITPPLPGQQPGPVISATVDYTPDAQQCSGDPLECPEDSFTFKVDDGDPPPGLSDTAVVTINPGGDPQTTCTTDADCDAGFFCRLPEGVCEPKLAQIVAKDALIADDTAHETESGVPVAITLVAAAPLAPEPDPIDDLVFTVIGGPTGGTLSAVVAIDPVTSPIRSATTTFTPTCTPTSPPTPATCVGSFVFKACEVANTSNCDTATVEIVVSANEPPKPPVAEDVSAASVAGSEVVFSLLASEGSPLTCSSDADCDDGFFCKLPEGVCEPEDGGGRQSLAGFAASAGGGFDPLDNGGGWSARSGLRGRGSSHQSLQLDNGSGWQQFTWWDETAGGTPQPTCTGPTALLTAATNQGGPFTFTVPEFQEGCLRITDVLLTGDQFRVLDGVEVLATTPLVPSGGPNVGDDPDAAFASPDYSHAQITLSEGAHSITIETIPGNSLYCGRGYLRLDTAIDGCDAAPPLLIYTVLTVPDTAFATIETPTGQTVTAGTVLSNPNLVAVVAAGATGTNTQTTYTATSTATGLVSNVATATLGILATPYPFGNCLTSETLCDDGRGGTSLTGGASGSEIDRKIRGPRLTVAVEGKGDVATSQRWHDGRSYMGLACGGGSSCGGNFEDGSTVVLYARPTEHDSEFVEWGGDCRGSDPVTVVTIGRRMECTALFRTRDDD